MYQTSKGLQWFDNVQEQMRVCVFVCVGGASSTSKYTIALSYKYEDIQYWEIKIDWRHE